MSSSSDDAKRLLSGLEVPWDELRQRRVLGKVEAKLAARKHARRKRPWLVAAGAGGGLLAAAAAVVAFVAFTPDDPVPTDEPVIAIADTTPPHVEPQIPDQSALTLPDGSLATMMTGARVDVDVQTDDLVRLVQRAGTVRYEVTPNPARRFVVDAEGVEVRVIGTVFTVVLGDEDVRVAVERGRVEVEGAERVAELGAGDELKVDLPMLVDDPIVLEDDIEVLKDAGKAKTSKKAPAKPAATAKELLQRADAARMKGQMADAAAALGELVRRYPKDPRAYSSYFQLGKVERSRGHHAAAASAFSACFKRAPSGALAEDARAEAAVSWLAAGRRDRAAKAATAYLDRYPAGTHRARMKRLLAKTE